MRTDSEFDLIREFFSLSKDQKNGVLLGIGDDCALLDVPVEMELAISIDTLVERVHYPMQTSAVDIGAKALAVGLSDLAAMGAQPAWATLALTLPAADRSWLKGFAEGFLSLAQQHGVTLIGGDTTCGPVTVISVQVHGLIPQGNAIRRAGAACGDLIYTTGTLGDAAQGLHILQQELPVIQPHANWLQMRLNQPTPRVVQGIALRGLATAAIDISDGLLADLGHILEASKVGARLELENIPLSDSYLAYAHSMENRYQLALGGGDDYELCFTIPAEKKQELERLFIQQEWSCAHIGIIDHEPGLRCFSSDGKQYFPENTGYDHFVSP